MAEVVSTGVSHMCDNSTVSVKAIIIFYSCYACRYLGGLRLLQATCKKFYQYCAEHG